MMEDKATDKQKLFMQKLGIEFHQDCSKAYAREVIAEKVKTQEEETPSKSEVMYSNGKPVMPKNGKEFHLTEEAIRSNALRCAIELRDDFDWRKVKEFEEYIRHGNS